MFPFPSPSLSWRNSRNKRGLLTLVATATSGWYILCWISQQWKDEDYFSSGTRRTLATSLTLLGQTVLIYGGASLSSRKLVQSREFALSCGQLTGILLVLAFLFGTPMRVDTLMWAWTHSVQMAASICACGVETPNVVKWLNQAITDMHHDQIDPKDEGHPLVSRQDWTPKDSPLIILTAFMGVIGAWLGSVVTPLDWEKWWQQFPVNTFFGTAIFSTILFPYLLIKFTTVPPKAARSFSV
eukprot:gb/GECG01011656.1/.p1 GENE.gb/GECG01011656.1/~~gb/GECG01011656.1/.p1  ORF type:complete len:241 (+),score=11.66 gb/GECG01011656.1/:1-723(+)